MLYTYFISSRFVANRAVATLSVGNRFFVFAVADEGPSTKWSYSRSMTEKATTRVSPHKRRRQAEQQCGIREGAHINRVSLWST